MEYPKRIYLQVCVTHGIDCPEDVTWCVDRINESDIEYVLPDPQSPTPIGAAADTCPACKGSGKGRYPGQICCGTCDGDGQV